MTKETTPTSFFNEADMGLLNQPNGIQSEAVRHKDGPLLILSAAGSGKTRFITHRITYMITAHGVVLETLPAMTFTKGAAQEMKQRQP